MACHTLNMASYADFLENSHHELGKGDTLLSPACVTSVNLSFFCPAMETQFAPIDYPRHLQHKISSEDLLEKPHQELDKGQRSLVRSTSMPCVTIPGQQDRLPQEPSSIRSRPHCTRAFLDPLELPVVPSARAFLDALARLEFIEGGSQGHYSRTIPRGNSCSDLAPSAAAETGESQASPLSAIQIDVAFFKSYAKRIKKQGAMPSGDAASFVHNKLKRSESVQPEHAASFVYKSKRSASVER
jgi:hypothetical protein